MCVCVGGGGGVKHYLVLSPFFPLVLVPELGFANVIRQDQGEDRLKALNYFAKFETVSKEIPPIRSPPSLETRQYVGSCSCAKLELYRIRTPSQLSVSPLLVSMRPRLKFLLGEWTFVLTHSHNCFLIPEQNKKSNQANQNCYTLKKNFIVDNPHTFVLSDFTNTHCCSKLIQNKLVCSISHCKFHRNTIIMFKIQNYLTLNKRFLVNFIQEGGKDTHTHTYTHTQTPLQLTNQGLQVQIMYRYMNTVLIRSIS